MATRFQLYSLTDNTPIALLRDQLHSSFLDKPPAWKNRNGLLVKPGPSGNAPITPKSVIVEASSRFTMPIKHRERRWLYSRIMGWWATSDIQTQLGADPLGKDFSHIAQPSMGFKRHWKELIPCFSWADQSQSPINRLQGVNPPLAIQPFIQHQNNLLTPFTLLKALYHLGQCSFDSKADAIRFVYLALLANVEMPTNLQLSLKFDTYTPFGHDYEAHQELVLNQFINSPALALTLYIQQQWAGLAYPNFKNPRLKDESPESFLERYLVAILNSSGWSNEGQLEHMHWSTLPPASQETLFEPALTA